MKVLGYLLFSFIFNICRMIPIHQNRVVLYNGHNSGLNGNLLAIKNEIEKRRDDVKFYCFSKKDVFSGTKKYSGILEFFFVLPFYMATASQIFLNDNFLALGYCYPAKKAQIIQLWHGAGAFKKFGLSTEKDKKVITQVIRANKRLTHLFVTSKQVIPYYCEAFGVSFEKVYATGIPITDVYFDSEAIEAGKKRFYKKYPDLEEKKLLLVTPTFRKTEKENASLLWKYPFEKLREALGEEWIILIRMHPKYHFGEIPNHDFCRNVTAYPYITDLYFVSDLLITDYSSTVVEYVLLDKPIMMYAPDLLRYDRGFYRDYEEYAPGPVAMTEKELIAKIVLCEHATTKRRDFRNIQFDFMDCASSERIWKVLEADRASMTEYD